MVELDGGQHNHDEQVKRDHTRSEDLKRLGYMTLRFWNHEIDQNIEGVLHTIHTVLLDRLPHPAAARPPSPEGEGGRNQRP